LNVGNFSKRNLAARRCSDQNVADLFGRLPELWLETDDEIVQSLALNNLRCCGTSDCCFDQSIDVRDVQSVSRNARAIDGDSQTRLT